jgi:nucleoid-associated protein YgaU
MGNFEKLGILVIIILVVVMVVLMGWGMSVPEMQVQPAETQRELSRDTSQGSGESPNRNPGTEIVLPGPEGPRNEPVDPADDNDPPYPHPADPSAGNRLPRPSDEPPAVLEDLQHTVKDGDSYWSLAVKYYKHGKYATVLQQANPGVPASALGIGKTLIVPHPDKVLGGGTSSARSETPAPAVDAPSGTRAYRVKKGESLWKIAEREYGRGSEMSRIVAANPGIDPDHIGEGDTIFLPR